ncbi:hypothetical protein [Streptomyces sp. WMMC897]|uniref:hypothetical protein n=1 Tax=Streptomyces sp. WMMC897 TaxID=3014782 RepID=UPI0022B70DCF|nr:hypothetical protein [Streptomyces sp. WMMC897]MCZ7413898.1 hypothetical protein [Streptomyces sp. WMMC897]
MADDFRDTCRTIYSPSEYGMRAAAGAWLALAGAATQSNDRLRGIAGDAQAEPGVGLLELADRLGAVGGWGDGAGAVAVAIARQLQTAADATSKTVERVMDLEDEYDEQERLRDEKSEHDVMTASAMHQGNMGRLTREVNDELDALNTVYATVTGGNAPTAPEVSAANGPGAPARSSYTAESATVGGPTGEAVYVTAPNGSRVGAGDYPHSSVIGPDGGDFAGWVRSPNTGFLVDPATGREFDPASGRWIDPVTGRPFGAVTEYATRLAGLGGGPGPLTGGPVGLGIAAVGGGGTAAAFAGLYGGPVPPSVAHAGPAQGQVARQAAHNLSRRANVAGRLAMREAAQGGRPYMPPPGAHGSAGRDRAGAPAGAGRRRLAGEPAGTWRGRTADAAVRHRLTGSPAAPPPAPAARSSRGQGRRGRPGPGTDLTEDQSVWRPRGHAVGGVLGE